MSAYRLVVIGPGDELLDTVPLDGYALDKRRDQQDLGERVAAAMGGRHVTACAQLDAEALDL